MKRRSEKLAENHDNNFPSVTGKDPQLLTLECSFEYYIPIFQNIIYFLKNPALMKFLVCKIKER